MYIYRLILINLSSSLSGPGVFTSLRLHAALKKCPACNSGGEFETKAKVAPYSLAKGSTSTRRNDHLKF